MGKRSRSMMNILWGGFMSIIITTAVKQVI